MKTAIETLAKQLFTSNELQTSSVTSFQCNKDYEARPSRRSLLESELRANVGIYRESQISSEKSNFGLYHPNNPLVWLFQKMILKNPQALCIWIILEKFENSQKNAIFIHEISHNFERIQRHSTGAKDLLLTSSSSHV